jgi:EpsI family protein
VNAVAKPLNTRRELLIGGTLAGAALAAGALRFGSGAAVTHVQGQLDQLVPGRLGDWAQASFASVLIPVGETAEERTYDDLITRFYQHPDGTGIMLLIAYSASQAGETALHRPEVCYPAAGFDLSRAPDTWLSYPPLRIAAATMTAVAPGRMEQLLYWSRVGHAFPTTSLDQRLTVLRQSLSGRLPDGALVRMSIISEDRTGALLRLKSFAGTLLNAGGADLRRLLIGT